MREATVEQRAIGEIIARMRVVRRQHQTAFGPGVGNCFSTCVANMLGLDVAEVPNVCADNPGEAGEWYYALNEWLAARGYFYIEFPFSRDLFRLLPKGAVGIGSGESPRFPGVHHSVLWGRGGLVHDPHPDGTGLVGDPIEVGFVMVLAVDGGMI